MVQAMRILCCRSCTSFPDRAGTGLAFCHVLALVHALSDPPRSLAWRSAPLLTFDQNMSSAVAAAEQAPMPITDPSIGAHFHAGEGTSFCVWAPFAEQVE